MVYYIIYNSKNKISLKLNIYDLPNEDRKIHKKKTSSFGGILLFSSLLIYFIFFVIFKEIYINKLVICFAILTTAYFIIGLLDDALKLGAYYKLSVLFILTYGVLFLEPDFTIKKLYFNFGDYELSTSHLDIFFSTFCILLLVNALNLADGINGLATKISIIWIVYFQILLFNIHSSMGISLFLILLIVFFDIYKGKYFLGNSGVMLLSIIISLLFIYNYNITILTKKIFVEEIFILFMVPGIDMFRLFLQRIKNKRDPFSADQNHLHHYLIKNFSLNITLFIYFLLISVPLFLLKIKVMSEITIIIVYATIYSFFIYANTKLQK